MNDPRLPPVLVAAGGTGGHLFPAAALAGALTERGIAVHLATDRRAARFGEAFADDAGWFRDPQAAYPQLTRST